MAALPDMLETATEGVRSRLEGRLARLGRAGGILMYHRVAIEPSDPWELCVSPKGFDAQLAWLKAKGAAVSLADLAARRAPGVAITFDDGYRDNLTKALPLLDKHDIPATVFVVGGAVGAKQEFWWDALERYVLRPKSLPPVLELSIADETLRREIAPSEPAGPGWRAEDAVPLSARQALFLDLWKRLMDVEPTARDEALDALRAWSGVTEPPSEDRLPMDEEELSRLAAHPLIEIGGHSDTHAALPGLSLKAQRREIAAGKKRLEAITGRELRLFAYPYGRRNRASAAIVRDLGFAAACTTSPGRVTSLSDPFALHRIRAVDGKVEQDVSAWLPALGGRA